MVKRWSVLLVLAALVGCGGSGSDDVEGGSDPDSDSTLVDSSPSDQPSTPRRLHPTSPSDLDTRCDEAMENGAVWVDCEATNYARTLEGPTEQVSIPFLRRFVEQTLLNTGDLEPVNKSV